MGVINEISRSGAEERAREQLASLLASISDLSSDELASLLDKIDPSYGNYQIFQDDEY